MTSMQKDPMKDLGRPEKEAGSSEAILRQTRLRSYRGNEKYVFLSYAHKDIEMAMEIIAILISKGVRVWFDEGIDPGTEWDKNIADHVDASSLFFALISENYLKSNNCLDELALARDQNIKSLLIYLENIKLPNHIKLRHGRTQYISRYPYDRNVFTELLLRTEGLSACTDKQSKQSSENDHRKPVQQAPNSNQTTKQHQNSPDHPDNPVLQANSSGKSTDNISKKEENILRIRLYETDQEKSTKLSVWMKRQFPDIQEYQERFRLPIGAVMAGGELPEEELERLLGMSESETKDIRNRLEFSLFDYDWDLISRKHVIYFTFLLKDPYIEKWFLSEEAGPFRVSEKDALMALAEGCWMKFQESPKQLSAYEVKKIDELLKKAGMKEALKTVLMSKELFNQQIKWGDLYARSKKVIDTDIAMRLYLKSEKNAQNRVDILKTTEARDDLIHSYKKLMCIYKREIEFFSLKKKDEDFREYYRKKYNEVFAKWSALKKARSPWRRLFKKPGIIKE